MRKRLRKKKRLGEFREFGAELHITLRPGTDLDAFLDEFILQAVEANGLAFGGGGMDLILNGFIELGRRDACPENLGRVKAWLLGHESVEAFDFGELVDANHAR